MSAGTPFANVLLVARLPAIRRAPSDGAPAICTMGESRHPRTCIPYSHVIHGDQLPGPRPRAPARRVARRRAAGWRPAASRPCDLDTYVGEVAGIDDQALPGGARGLRLPQQPAGAAGALRQDGFDDAVRELRSRAMGRERVGVFLGTSTSGILETETGLPPSRSGHRRAAGGLRLRRTRTTRSRWRTSCARCSACGARRSVISTACSSSAKVFASAPRMIAAGLIDAAVVGGVDSLCLTTLYGFDSLQLLSRAALPAVRRGRDGISIGEAARTSLLERAGRNAARTGALAAGRRRIQRRVPHVLAASGGARRTPRDGGRACRGRAARRPTSTT